MVDQLLSGVSNMMVPAGMIAEKLLTPLKVKESSGLLGKYGKGHLRIVDSRIVGRGEAPRVQLIERDITTSYQMEGHGLEGLVTADDYRNVKDPFKAEEDETMALTLNLALGKEFALAANLANTSVITNNVTLSGSQQFSDPENSDPLGVSDTAVETILDATGQVPNVAFMDAKVLLRLRRHPQIWDRLGFKYTQNGKLSQEQVAEALGVEEIMIASAFYNSAKKGQADAIARVWGKHLWFAKLEKAPAPYQTTGGYYLTYEGEKPREVTKEPTFNPKGGTKVLVTDNHCMLLSDVGCFYLVKNAIA